MSTLERVNKAVKGVSPLSVSIRTGIGTGVFWYAWGKFGFWWGLTYGFFWQTWLGYHLAMYLLG